ncbi:2-oxoglutarate dehydrogenase E2 component (dihydrolipoamide succinyltransferase) [bacterium A37T11]|nr:2-oxoglutarate dehydrogenase E2 component (dihydrolipoamide succinyltransferase) [bacterium A37T11]
MAKYNLQLPKMGESVSEATIIKWLKQPGDQIEADEAVLEIATDKVDSDVPSPFAGVLIEQRFKENEVAQIGDVVAVLEIAGDEHESPAETEVPYVPQPTVAGTKSARFYSPLVKNIASEEGISDDALDKIVGTGAEGRVTKQDLLNYLASLSNSAPSQTVVSHEIIYTPPLPEPQAQIKNTQPAPPVIAAGDEIIEMDRMRKIIADHMVYSMHTAPHVCSFVEADVTNIVQWRNKIKDDFEKREGTKITFTPLFIEAVAKALRDFPMVNVSVNGTQIIKKKNINIGMAAALPTGNLIVPVIKNADQLNLVGITKAVNDLASRARQNKLRPDEIQEGTFTLTNIGAFGNIMGTPIINQPQVAILAVGTITKKPAVLETEFGDVIAVRHKMYLSMSYDHRVVDGALGGTFLKRVADYLENWNPNREY